jgi:imidazolonepropionase-like amidohydrolase
MAAAFGLSKDDALKSVTLWPAQILGVADRFGSIEPGKVANLVVTTGDILEARTDTKYSSSTAARSRSTRSTPT